MNPASLPSRIALALLLSLPAVAAAQTYVCPGGPGPGEVQVGEQGGHGFSANGGFNGVPVCSRNGASGGEMSAEALAASYGPGPDPMAHKLETAIEMHKMMLDGQVREIELMRDPRYQRYVNGGWDYFQDSPNAKPGELCTAFYSRRDGYVSVTTPGSDSPNAYLTFWGPDIPKPAEVRKVKVTLSQTGDPPQTVTAFNMFNPATTMGGIVLAIPNVDALLDNMSDVLGFTLALEGKVVAQVEWRDGHAARDELKACLAKGGAKNRH